MQKLVLSIIILLLPLSLSAQNTDADKILGEWLNEERDKKIQIYSSENRYHGKVIWASNLIESDGQTSKKDVKNPDKKLRNRNLIDATILNNFAFVNGIWDNGTFYDSKSGKTFSCTIKLKGRKMEIRSYVGISLFGKSTYWERLE
jgi:uncharacterized protein (DUF2147 family)